MSKRIIGIMGAMPEEIAGITALLENKVEKALGRRIYTAGTLNGIDTVVVFSRWGKVAAAATVSTLILEYKVTEVIFTGVAGAIAPYLSIGDVVIGKRLVQHDMDARPIMPRFEIPLIHTTYFESNAERIAQTETALSQLSLPETIGRNGLDDFGITSPKVFTGDIASGDKFFASNAHKKELLQALPDTLCVEMEGAAVAQVCYEYHIPFTIIRTISDSAGDESHIDFHKFIQEVASKYSAAIVQQLLTV